MSIQRINMTLNLNSYNKNYGRICNKVNNLDSKDKIEISKFGKSLSNYSQNFIIDKSENIKEIKNKIENGNYNVNAQLTAQSILNFIKENKL